VIGGIEIQRIQEFIRGGQAEFTKEKTFAGKIDTKQLLSAFSFIFSCTMVPPSENRSCVVQYFALFKFTALLSCSTPVFP